MASNGEAMKHPFRTIPEDGLRGSLAKSLDSLLLGAGYIGQERPDPLRWHAAEQLGIEGESGFEEDEMLGAVRHVRV